MIINGIGTGGVFPAGGAACLSGAARPAGQTAAGGGPVRDSVRFSLPQQGEGAQVRALTAQLSGQLRVRPTRVELEATRRQVLTGAYRPDAREIAARLLLQADGEG